MVVLIHELGHALLAPEGGYRVTSFGVGAGRPLFRTRLSGGVVFFVAPMVLVGGSCTAIPVGPAGPRRAWFHGGGLIAQGQKLPPVLESEKVTNKSLKSSTEMVETFHLGRELIWTSAEAFEARLNMLCVMLSFLRCFGCHWGSV